MPPKQYLIRYIRVGKRSEKCVDLILLKLSTHQFGDLHNDLKEKEETGSFSGSLLFTIYITWAFAGMPEEGRRSFRHSGNSRWRLIGKSYGAQGKQWPRRITPWLM